MVQVYGWRRWLGVVLAWCFVPFTALATSDDDTFARRTTQKHYPAVLADAFKVFPQEQLGTLHAFLKEVPEVETELLRRADMPLARVARNMGVAKGEFGHFIWDPRHEAYLVVLAALNPGLFQMHTDPDNVASARAFFARLLFLMDHGKAACVLARPSLYGPYLVGSPQMILDVSARKLNAITPTQSTLTKKDVTDFCSRLKGVHESVVFERRMRKIMTVCAVIFFAYLMNNG